MGMEAEKRRLEDAKAVSIEQLNALAEQAREEAGADAALLFETHAMFIEDEDFCDCMDAALMEQPCTAERAVELAGEQFSAMLAEMDDPYMQARAADIRDVARRMRNNLMGVTEGGIDVGEPVILAAGDLAPSETLQLDKRSILGFLTQGGSSSSHTAILARTMGIPAICGLGDALDPALNGCTVYMDGETGQVVLEPDGPI